MTTPKGQIASESIMKKQINFSSSARTVWSLLELVHPVEYIFSVDYFPVWYSHMAWAKTSGHELRELNTERYEAVMIFMVLVLGVVAAVLFSAATESAAVREAMRQGAFWDVNFWAGTVMLACVCSTTLTLIATFTAWGMISPISNENVHTVLRSSVGQYVTNFPARLTVASMYLFLLWILLLMTTFTPPLFSAIYITIVLVIFFGMVTTFSAFGRLIIHTGAMGKKHILDPEFERSLLPSGLHASLLIKALDEKERENNVIQIYRDGDDSLEDITQAYRKAKQEQLARGASARSIFTTSKDSGETGVVFDEKAEQEMRILQLAQRRGTWRKNRRSTLFSSMLGMRLTEFEKDALAREQYDQAPPVDLSQQPPLEFGEQQPSKSAGSKRLNFPRPSVLNRTLGAGALRELTSRHLGEDHVASSTTTPSNRAVMQHAVSSLSEGGDYTTASLRDSVLGGGAYEDDAIMETSGHDEESYMETSGRDKSIYTEATPVSGNKKAIPGPSTKSA